LKARPFPFSQLTLQRAGRTRAAGDAVGAEGVPDAAAVRGAVGQVAVVVVHREVDRVPVRGAAAVDHGGGVALAAGDQAVGALARRQAFVPDGVHGRPAGGGAEAGDEQLREVPVRRAGDDALAVPFIPQGSLVAGLGAGVTVAIDARVVLGVGRRGD